MTISDIFLAPFVDYAFMRRALAACVAIAISGAPLGVFLVLRRMTLAGDAISHAIFPGVALAFMFCGFSLTAMTIGGISAGLIIAIIAGTLTHYTQIKEDASFTATYLLSLAAGVLMLSLHGSSMDVIHVLFGNVLAMSRSNLVMVCSISSLSALALAAIYRSLILYCFDAGFLKTTGSKTMLLNILFLSLVVLNLVSAFQALGTLMALSLIVLPAIASRFWTNNIDGAVLFSILASMFSSYAGLLLSFHISKLPSGPAIVLFAGSIYIASVLFGRIGSLRLYFVTSKHFTS